MTDTILSTGDIADLQRVAREAMAESWTLENPGTPVDDGQGGYVTPWTAVTSGSAATDTGALLMPAGYQAREQIMQERPAAIGAWVITLPAGTPVQPDNRIVINGRYFYVTGVGGPHTWDTTLQVPAAEVR
jgi:hypothetical protein